MTTISSWQKAGFFQGEANIEKIIQQLENHVNEMPGIFQNFSEEERLLKTTPSKWSKQEILGHLIDSALNNLKRFTEIQFSPKHYRVISYRQNELVEVNHYQDLPIDHLLGLWKALNQQIVYVVNSIPEEKLDYPVDPQYDNGETKSLGWIICDYVSHLEHHLKEITGKL